MTKCWMLSTTSLKTTRVGSIRKLRRIWAPPVLGRSSRPLRKQAFGQSLDPDKLERLGRYEVRLDRKFERTLAMLLRLKGLRLG